MREPAAPATANSFISRSRPPKLASVRLSLARLSLARLSLARLSLARLSLARLSLARRWRALSRFARLAPLSLLALLCGCGGPPVTDSIATISLSLTARATQPELAALGESEGGLAVTRAFVSVSNLTLVPCRAGAASIVLPARGYDLMLEPPPSELVDTAVPELCEIRLDVDPVSKNVTEGVPEGASSYVRGTDAEGADFELVSSASSSLRFATTEGFSFGLRPLILAFDVSAWLSGVSADPDSADDALEFFETQQRGAVAIYVDDNENRAIDEDEQTPVALASDAR